MARIPKFRRPGPALPYARQTGQARNKPDRSTQALSLAYSPGVAVPLPTILRRHTTTPRAAIWCVILTDAIWAGKCGALAAKPVMGGLFKRFADVDSIDLEVDLKI